jgi:adenylylsulfate kinase-like enzyme
MEHELSPRQLLFVKEEMEKIEERDNSSTYEKTEAKKISRKTKIALTE